MGECWSGRSCGACLRPGLLHVGAHPAGEQHPQGPRLQLPGLSQPDRLHLRGDRIGARRGPTRAAPAELGARIDRAARGQRHRVVRGLVAEDGQPIRVDRRQGGTCAESRRCSDPELSGGHCLAGLRGQIRGAPGTSRVFGGPSSNVAGPETFPIDASDVWFVLSPSQGIEVPSTSATDRAIGSVARLPGVKLVDRADGLWVFRWRPPSATHTVALGPPRAALPAWTTAGTSARAVLAGSPNRWRVTSNGASGYVVSGDIWRLNPGRYNARLSLSSTAPANVEIWSDASSGDVLLAGRRVRSKHSRKLTVPFAVKQPAPAPNSTGPVPFAYEPVPPPRGATVEVRVWTPGSGSTTVQTVDVQPSSD